MRIGIRAHDMEQAPFEELVKNIHKKGFFCTHIALKKSIQEFSVDEEEIGRASCRERVSVKV